MFYRQSHAWKIKFIVRGSNYKTDHHGQSVYESIQVVSVDEVRCVVILIKSCKHIQFTVYACKLSLYNHHGILMTE